MEETINTTVLKLYVFFLLLFSGDETKNYVHTLYTQCMKKYGAIWKFMPIIFNFIP